MSPGLCGTAFCNQGYYFLYQCLFVTSLCSTLRRIVPASSALCNKSLPSPLYECTWIFQPLSVQLRPCYQFRCALKIWISTSSADFCKLFLKFFHYIHWESIIIVARFCRGKPIWVPNCLWVALRLNYRTSWVTIDQWDNWWGCFVTTYSSSYPKCKFIQDSSCYEM